MAADDDRLFQIPEGLEIPDEVAAHTDCDVNSPPAPPPGRPNPLTTSARPRSPMPIDRTHQLDRLGGTFKRRIGELASALSDDFDRSESR